MRRSSARLAWAGPERVGARVLSGPDTLPLLHGFDAGQPLFLTGTERSPATVSQGAFLARAAALSPRLPAAPQLVNLCDDRYAFALTFAAALLRGSVSLFPPNRLAATVHDVARDFPDAVCVTDRPVPGLALPAYTVPENDDLPGTVAAMPTIDAERESFVAFTSGSTGRPRPHRKYWGDLVGCARAAARRFGFGPQQSIVATVPPQHMYGLELSILVPFVTGARIVAARPFFPADIRSALAMAPAPRVLVTTPVHLRACLEADLDWPEVALIISATAPLPESVAARAEDRLSGRVCEVYGSTESGSVASRETCRERWWRWYEGVRPKGDGDAVRITADFVHGTVPLADVLEIAPDGGFRLVGRSADMIKVGGKRASLAELNLKLNAIDGVRDGVFVAPDADGPGVGRLAVVAVAPGLDRQTIIAGLAGRIDPVFYPRRVRLVDRLPRNESGKLPRDALLRLLSEGAQEAGDEH